MAHAGEICELTHASASATTPIVRRASTARALGPRSRGPTVRPARPLAVTSPKAIAGAAPPSSDVMPPSASRISGASDHGAPVWRAWKSRLGTHGRDTEAAGPDADAAVAPR